MILKKLLIILNVIAVSLSYSHLSFGETVEDSSHDSDKKWRDSFKNIFILNEDNDRFFIQSPEMTVEALNANIDRLGGTHATHFFMCPNGQRTSYDSKVHEPIWTPVFGKQPTNKWAINCKLLKDRGIDPYSVWIKACRNNKISPWMTMRMNDVHFVTTPDYFRNQNFWREHRQLWRKPQKELPLKGAWDDYAFNYKYKEVRDFYLALVRELFERYDFDGFELDWMRFGRHLTPNNEINESLYLTEFTREVKKIAKEWEAKRGHKIGISARVCATPELSVKNGYDVAAWAKEGIVDLVIPSNIYHNGDSEISVKEWKKYLGDSAENVVVIPSTDNGFSPSHKVKRQAIELPLLDGWATSVRYSGAESLYFFNPFYQPKLLATIITRGMDENISRNSHRRHPVSMRDMGRTPEEQKLQLPVSSQECREFKIMTGKKPLESAQGTLSAVVAFSGIKGGGGNGEAKFSVKLNGFDSTGFKEEKNPKKFGNAARALRFFFDYSALKNGYNMVRVEPLEGEPQNLVWVEIDTTPPLQNQSQK